MMKGRYGLALGLILTVSIAGCMNPKEKFGRTWYIDGAGNFGFGAIDVPLGLEEAGYQGLVSNHRWSIIPFNPVLDQTFRFVARGSGEALGREITNYLKRNPDADANIIALSAGTGVGVWAIEHLTPPAKVNNFILLGSSLSYKYDMRKALSNMKGNVYVYFAKMDPILQGPVRVLGTIDGTYDDSAGLVGLHGKGFETGRIKNIGWNPKYVKLGWTGGHVDCVNHKFVASELRKWIISPKHPLDDPAKRAQYDLMRSTYSSAVKYAKRIALLDRFRPSMTHWTAWLFEIDQPQQTSAVALNHDRPSN